MSLSKHAFGDDEEAAAFVRVLREVVQRDDLTVLAWCLMSNHFHMAVRTGLVSLDRPMRSLQQRVTRGVNARRRVFGPLWQGRYRAKLVTDQQYLDQLLIYIHLNPVAAGIVVDPAEYPWSGHREVLGKVKAPVVHVDEVLRVFGTTRRSARAAYVRRLKGARDETWIGESPGHLPWWRFGRPPKGEDDDPEAAIREKRAREVAGPEWRPAYEAADFVANGAEALGVALADLRSRRQGPELARKRELLLLLGIERYGLKLKDLAAELRKSPDGMSKAVARASHKRGHEQAFRADLDRLDGELAKKP